MTSGCASAYACSFRSIQRSVRLREQIKNAVQQLRRQANSGIDYFDHRFVRAFDAFNPHRGYLALIDLASRPLGLSAGLAGLFALAASRRGADLHGVA